MVPHGYFMGISRVPHRYLMFLIDRGRIEEVLRKYCDWYEERLRNAREDISQSYCNVFSAFLHFSLKMFGWYTFLLYICKQIGNVEKTLIWKL